MSSECIVYRQPECSIEILLLEGVQLAWEILGHIRNIGCSDLSRQEKLGKGRFANEYGN